jgi:glycogen debranching enzyme
MERSISVQLCKAPDSWEGEANAIFQLSLKPDECYTLEYSLEFSMGKSEKIIYTFDQARSKMEAELVEARKEFAQVFTSNEQFNHWINRSHSDMLSLLSHTRDGRYPYAGVPWYNTAFGRDGIITAYETLWVAPVLPKMYYCFLQKTRPLK